MKLCECGCGNPAPLANRNIRRRDLVKGQPFRFIHGHNGRGKYKPILFSSLYKTDDATGCWIWQRYCDKKGYGIIRTQGQLVKAHRYFFEKLKQPIPIGFQLDHLCRNKSCVNPDHLEIVTSAENSRRGINTKLTKEQVNLIKSECTKGRIQRKLAMFFGVSPCTINCIVKGRTWK